MLGKHNGYWFHTIGQRKGLGLSGGPWFVIKKDIKRNIIYVSNGYDPETQYGKIINMHGFDFITEDPWGEFEDEKEITFKIRHTPDFTHGRIRRIGDLYRIESDNKIQGIAPGQYGVVYDKDHRHKYDGLWECHYTIRPIISLEPKRNRAYTPFYRYRYAC